MELKIIDISQYFQPPSKWYKYSYMTNLNRGSHKIILSTYLFIYRLPSSLPPTAATYPHFPFYLHTYIAILHHNLTFLTFLPNNPPSYLHLYCFKMYIFKVTQSCKWVSNVKPINYRPRRCYQGRIQGGAARPSHPLTDFRIARQWPH